MRRWRSNFLSALLGLSCSIPAVAEDGIPREWGETVAGCQLSVRSEKSSYRVGEQISLSVMLRNAGEDHVIVLRAEQRMIYKVEVIRPDGVDAPMTPEQTRRSEAPSSGSIARVPLAASGTIEDRYDAINREYDMSDPGEYTVILTRLLITQDPHKTHSVSSNRAKVKVEAGDSSTRPTTEQKPTTQPKSQAQEERERKVQKGFRSWTDGILSESFRPPADARVELVARGQDESPVDLARVRYKVEDRTVTVTQIASAICLKVEGLEIGQVGPDTLAVVTKLAKECFLNSDGLILVWDESKQAKKKSGRTQDELEQVRPFLRHLQFEIREDSIVFYGMKLQDGLSGRSLGMGLTSNHWFTLPAKIDPYPKDDFAPEIRDALLR